MLENRGIINYETEAEWLALRMQDYTSTVTPGLFNLSPYITPFEIYHACKSGLQVPFEPNERTEKGKRLEAAIAEEVGLELDCEVKPMKFYARIPGTKIGSSFDYQINHKMHGWIPLEIKCVDWRIYKNAWLDDQAPDHIELQVQHQMFVANAKHCVLAAATGIYDIHIYERDFDPGVGVAIDRAVQDMEERMALGNAPAPDFTRDGAVIDLIYPRTEGDLNATGDTVIEGLASKYKRLKAEAALVDKELDAIKAELHFKMGDKAKAWTEDHVINAGWTKESEGTVITQEMVGTTINARKPYRKLLIKETK